MTLTTVCAQGSFRWTTSRKRPFIAALLTKFGRSIPGSNASA